MTAIARNGIYQQFACAREQISHERPQVRTNEADNLILVCVRYQNHILIKSIQSSTLQMCGLRNDAVLILWGCKSSVNPWKAAEGKNMNE